VRAATARATHLSRQSRHAGAVHRARDGGEKFFCGRRIEAISGDGFATITTLILAFPRLGREYRLPLRLGRSLGPATRPALRRHSRRGRAPLYLAGDPRDREAQLRAAGVEAFIHRGCDAIAILRAAHEQMAVHRRHQRVADQEQQEPRSELSDETADQPAIWCG